MTAPSLAPVLKEHAFVKGLEPEYLDLIIECAHNVVFQAGEFIVRQGEDANHFYLIRHGKVAIEISSPARQGLIIQTLTDNDVLGWSWLFPPYQWQFDAQATELTRAIALNGLCLRGKCDSDPGLGYELMKRFSSILFETLQVTQLQLLDLYGVPTRD